MLLSILPFQNAYSVETANYEHLDLKALRRKYRNPVRSLCVKFDEILTQMVRFSDSNYVQEKCIVIIGFCSSEIKVSHFSGYSYTIGMADTFLNCG